MRQVQRQPGPLPAQRRPRHRRRQLPSRRQHPQDERRHPLTDDDRAGWLDTLAEQLRQAVAAGKLPVLTCSALKRAYRDRLRRAVPGLGIVYLN